MRSIRGKRPDDLLVLHAPRRLHALPGTGVHGGQHARAVVGGLREILRADGNPQREYGAIGNRAAGLSSPCVFVVLPTVHNTNPSQRRATILAIVRCDRRATYFRANRAWTVWIVEEEQKPREIADLL